MSEDKNLDQYVIKPITQFIGKKAERIYYTDIGGPSDMTTDGKGIDIIAHQVILKFEDSNSLCVAWTGQVRGWEQYAISASVESYVIPDAGSLNTFAVKSKYWETIMGKRLTGFSVYGYKEYIAVSVSCETGTSTETIYYDQPHLIIFDFEDSQVTVANFYLANDFKPKFPIGDDIWIIFDANRRDEFIEKLELEKL